MPGSPSWYREREGGSENEMMSPRTKALQRRWEQYRDMSDMADCQWSSWTCTIGLPVMGIWPPDSDGTDVNMTDRTKSRKLIATAEDTKMIGLMRFPCLGMSRDKKGKLIPGSMGKKRKVSRGTFFVIVFDTVLL